MVRGLETSEEHIYKQPTVTLNKVTRNGIENGSLEQLGSHMLLPLAQEALTGQFAGWRGHAAAAQGTPHQHAAHLLCGTRDYFDVAFFHHLLVAPLGSSQSTFH